MLGAISVATATNYGRNRVPRCDPSAMAYTCDRSCMLRESVCWFAGPEGSFTHQAALRLCAKNKSAPARFRVCIAVSSWDSTFVMLNIVAFVYLFLFHVLVTCL